MCKGVKNCIQCLYAFFSSDYGKFKVDDNNEMERINIVFQEN
jgi:hypothetical protein